jgi:hypothetical protein
VDDLLFERKHRFKLLNFFSDLDLGGAAKVGACVDERALPCGPQTTPKPAAGSAEVSKKFP